MLKILDAKKDNAVNVGVKLNASKTKIMIVSRSRTMQPQSLPLTNGGTRLKESGDLDKFGVTFDSMMTFRFPEKLLNAWYLEKVLESIP